MTQVLYSTNYTDYGNTWSIAHGAIGFFQIKEDQQTGEFVADSTAHQSPSFSYYENDWERDYEVIDYDTARHWPHP
jgi:hypothetical protein